MTDGCTQRANHKLTKKSLLVIGLFAGFSPSLSAAKLSEGMESTVYDCQFLGKVEGSSGYGKHPGVGWEPLAKASALHRAEKLGATDVVWQRMIEIGAFNGIAVARAYKCNTES